MTLPKDFAWRVTAPVNSVEGVVKLEVGDELEKYSPLDYLPMLGQVLIQLGVSFVQMTTSDETDDPEDDDDLHNVGLPDFDGFDGLA